MIRRFGLYTAANALAMTWTLFAVTREWVLTVPDDAQLELVVLTVPLALLAAATVTVLVAWALPEARRDAFLRRHFAIYLVTPALLFLLSRGGGVTTQHLGAVFLLAIAAWTAHALEGLWHVVANLADQRTALTLAAVLLVPYFALVRYENSTMPTVSDEPLYLIIGAAALAAQLYLACRDARVAHRPALLGATLVCVTHPILSYTTQVYPELVAALAFVSAARFVRAGRGTTPLALAAAAACVSVLPWLSARAALIALGVGLVIAYCALRPMARASLAHRAVRVAAAAVPFIALLGALSFVNLVSDQQQVLAFAPQVGALGLLFDRTFGLIPRAPIYLVAALGVIPLWRRGPSASLVALVLGWIVSFTFIASIADWWADGAPPSRYILAGLPLIAVLLAAGLEQLATLRTPVWRGVGAALAAFSLFIAYVFAVLPSVRYDKAVDIRLTERDGQLFEFVGRLVRPDLAAAFPSIVRGTPLDLALGAAWVAVVAALLVIGGKEAARRYRRAARRRGTASG